MNTVLQMNTTMKMIVLKFVMQVQSYIHTTLKRQEGQGMVEYALIIALVAIVLVIALTSLSGGIGAAFDKIKAALAAA